MLGAGAYGEVRNCFTIPGNIQRAVKIITKDEMDEDLMDSFKMEMITLKILDHPNILKVHEFFED